ncbi:MAG: 1-deoxy-D-xylulose-5-phosphate synthase [Candidatus Melainabacteria bacterium]|nr:1-deoxy-D-xylulose-5-phosphate synthase [Candidatus Melainabacteria bacterium]
MSTILAANNSFLETLTGPAQLKHLQLNELTQLSEEIRKEIINNVSRTGGHLASNLGIVEITLGLHYVFNSPKDKILWDVGHQAYAHKMLTGRRESFATLRQYKGLSGFINPTESEHDAFHAGHSSTALSLAVGMALARDHLAQDHKVVAVIGDGGLTGGMALEAINHLGHIQTNVLIVLNDNEMSISQNVGGFSQYMKRIKETFFYKDIKQTLDQIENQLDAFNLRPGLWELISSVKTQAKARFDTPGIVFEKLGINYTGPIDGHDIAAIVHALRQLQGRQKPQILHLITQKGKGYAPAEQDAIKYHGVPAFCLEKIEPVEALKPKAKTYSEVFAEAAIEIGKLEPLLVAITPATAEGSAMVKFGQTFPDRFFDVGICEQHAVTMAAGLAKAGLVPIVSIYSTFLQRAMDQVIHDVAIPNLPVIFGVDRGGLVEDGETHQGVFDIAHLRCIPNFTVLAPKDATELRNMVYTAVRYQRGPVAIRFPRDKAVDGNHGHPLELIDCTKWETIHHGNHIIILAYGAMVDIAKQTCSLLQAKNINPTIINARSCKPLDVVLLRELLNTATNQIVTLEEGCMTGGFGSAVLEFAAQERLNHLQHKQATITLIGVPDRFIEHGSRKILLDINGLSPNDIANFILHLSTQA